MRIRAVFFDVGERSSTRRVCCNGWADHMGVGRAEFIAVLDDVMARREHYRRVYERGRTPRSRSSAAVPPPG